MELSMGVVDIAEWGGEWCGWLFSVASGGFYVFEGCPGGSFGDTSR
jgi:hypothetical protein